MKATEQATERSPRGQGELLRERLIDAGLAMLDDGHETADISIRGVTRQAGVSPTAFYLHFDRREQLIRTLVERSFASLRERIGEAAARGTDPKQRLLGAGAAYIAFANEQPERYRLIFGADWDEEGIKDGPDDSIEVADAAFTDLIELITAYLDSNGQGSSDADTLALGLWSGLHGFVTLCQTQPGLPVLTDEQYPELLLEAWLG